MRLKLTIAYDGRPFQGWASQVGGNTVQDLLSEAASIVAKVPIKIYGSGRTDTGVHALAQIGHFDAPDDLTMNPFNWVPALNTKLPAQIRVLECEEAAPDFHARFSATGKEYRYELGTDPVLSPFRAGMAWHIPRQLDPTVLQQALDAFVGSHDFQGFAAKRGHEDEDTDWVRTIHEARLEAISDGWRITYRGDGFLYKMARLLTGGAVHTAQGRMRFDDFSQLLDQPAGLPFGKSPVCAPADGLTLVKVEY